MSDQDDIKSMIKSRRDERYYGSAFEKMDPRLAHAVSAASYDRSMGYVNNKGAMSPEKYEAAHREANKTEYLSNDWPRDMTWDDERLGAHQLDPDHEEYIGRRRRDTRNVGIPQKQPELSEIQEDAQHYADDLGRSELSGSDFEKYHQALLDQGFTEEDIWKFKEIYDALGAAKTTSWSDAQNNAWRIRDATVGRE